MYYFDTQQDMQQKPSPIKTSQRIYIIKFSEYNEVMETTTASLNKKTIKWLSSKCFFPTNYAKYKHESLSQNFEETCFQ